MLEPAEHILRRRLANHHLSEPRLEAAGEVVAWLGAMQAQDYAGARWGLGLRLRNASEAAIDLAFDRGEILRTHVLRPTWHFVAPGDIRWLLQLTAPRVKAMMLSYTRRLGLDEAILTHSQTVLTRALEGGRHLTRAEVGAALRKAGMEVSDGGIIGQILAYAELNAIVCSGPRRRRQHTYALLEDRAGPAPPRRDEEALAELTWRYFSSHGPALVSDCVWWSSLPARDIKRGLEFNHHRLASERVEGRVYWSAPSWSGVAAQPQARAHLLPNYDEYTVAYRHRDLYYDPARNATGNVRTDVPFTNVILVDGHVAGRWQRTAAAQLGIEATWTIEAGPGEHAALAAAEERYRHFFG